MLAFIRNRGVYSGESGIFRNQEIVADQGDALEWFNVTRLSFCSNCEELGFAPESEYGSFILTYGEDELGTCTVL